jgi:hypothetical protein
MSITYSECVLVVLIIQHKMDMRRVILPSVACLTTQYLTNGTILGEKILNVKCFSIFSPTLSDTFLIQRRIQRDIIICVLRSSCRVSLILVTF